jgi:hypothetical protein
VPAGAAEEAEDVAELATLRPRVAVTPAASKVGKARLNSPCMGIS